MDDLPEDEPGGSERLDGLFREAADEFEPAFNPSDWTSLSQRLDQHDRTVFWTTWLRRGSYALLLLLLTGLGLWLWSTNASETRPESEPAVAARRPAAVEDARPGNTGPEHASAPRPKADEKPARTTAPRHEPAAPETNPGPAQAAGEHAASTPAGDVTRSPSSRRPQADLRQNVDKYVDKSINRREPAAVAAPKMPLKGRLKEESGQNKLSTSGSNQNPVRGASPRSFRSEGGRSDIPEPYAADRATTGDGPLTPAVNLPAEQRLRLAGLAPLRARPLWRPDSLLGRNESYFEASEPAGQAPRVAPPRWSPLSIRLAVTPDLSFLGGKGPAPALTYGGLVEYQLTRRLILQGGVLRSVKRYYATMNEYTLEHWYQYQKPDRIDATCTILDIPLGVRYNIVLSDRHRWFAGGGVSTYIMRKENYDYEYDQVLPGTKYWNWNGSTGRFNASHLNVSVGYERTFGRRLSWQIEPFLKAPLKGVGYGKVRLLTTGVLFSVRYNL